ncbi:MAG: hypothetical protein ACI4U5_01570 [Bacilli bacterium]
MEKDFGVRFTDEFYATKDEVKKALNISSIDSIWDKVIQYRTFFTKQLPLRNIEYVPYNIVLPQYLLNKVVKIEKRISHSLVKYIQISYTNQKDKIVFENDSYLNMILTLANLYDIKIDHPSALALINEEQETIPVEQLFLHRYIKVLKNIQNDVDDISLARFINIYGELRGRTFDVENTSSYIRQTDVNNRQDHVLVGKHYEGAPLERILPLLEDLISFLNKSPYCGLINACITYFYILYIKPFEYYNEEMAIILFKYVLSHFDNENIPSFVNIEESILSSSKIIDKMMLESEMKFDLTYISNRLIEIFDNSLMILEDKLKDFSISSPVENVEEDNGEIFEEKEVTLPPYQEHIEKEERELPRVNYSENIAIDGVDFEKKVSLPKVPVGLDEKDASLVAQHLLEIYPSLKKNQADFYSKHCTIGKYYTIAQYKREQNVVYETARTSMDNLVNLGFYKKEQIRNKFVYTPVVRD